jgi:hypothetical protein
MIPDEIKMILLFLYLLWTSKRHNGNDSYICSTVSRVLAEKTHVFGGLDGWRRESPRTVCN